MTSTLRVLGAALVVAGAAAFAAAGGAAVDPCTKGAPANQDGWCKQGATVTVTVGKRTLPPFTNGLCWTDRSGFYSVNTGPVVPKRSRRTAADPRFVEVADFTGKSLKDRLDLGHGTLVARASITITYKPGRKGGTFRGSVFLGDGVSPRTPVTGSFTCKRVLRVPA